MDPKTQALAIVAFMFALMSAPFVLIFVRAYPYQLRVEINAYEEAWLRVQQPLPVDHLQVAVENGDGNSLMVWTSDEPIVEQALETAPPPMADSVNLCRTGGALEVPLLRNGTVQLVWESNSTVPFDIYLDNDRVNASVAPAYGQMAVDMPLHTAYTAVNAMPLLPSGQDGNQLMQVQQSGKYRLRFLSTNAQLPECTNGGSVTLWLQLNYRPITGTFRQPQPIAFPVDNYPLGASKARYFIVRNRDAQPVAITLTAYLTTTGYLVNLLWAMVSGPMLAVYILMVFFCYPCLQWVLKHRSSRHYRYAAVAGMKQGDSAVMSAAEKQ